MQTGCIAGFGEETKHVCLLQFWKENVEKFEEKDFQILRVLLKLLEASRETRTLAVGCHDLGMFITNHPHGRSIVTGQIVAISTIQAVSIC